jgi:hypothetical protein
MLTTFCAAADTKISLKQTARKQATISLSLRPVLFMYVVNKEWRQLPEDSEIITPKRIEAT